MNCPQKDHAAGFTLIELLVVMGLLTGFLVMLVQLVDGGIRLFNEGETGQVLADRAGRAQRVITTELAALRGSAQSFDRGGRSPRLVVQQLPIGLPNEPDPKTTWVPVVRAGVHLPLDRELGLLDAMLMARVLASEPELPADVVEKRVAAMRAFEAPRGHGQLLLLPWRQDDAPSLLELRAAWLLPGQLVPVGSDRFVDPFAVPVPGSAELPGLAVYRLTMPVLRDLLHFEVQLWGQDTERWAAGPPANGQPALAGESLSMWDSARGGWLVDRASGGVFPLDRGSASADDPRDDVLPPALLVRCVVAGSPDTAPDGLLAGDLANTDDTLDLVNGDRFPCRDRGGYVKVGTEWIGYAERNGDRLTGLRRGERGTSAQDHGRGLRVFVGRTVEFVVPLAFGKGDWNG
jgi:hypothetical protein